MNPSQINPEQRVHFNLTKNQYIENKTLDEKACNLIVRDGKTVENTTEASSTAQTPQAKRMDMQVLKYVRNDLLNSIPALGNRQKIRIEGRAFQLKSRRNSLISIKSRVGGAESKLVVQNILRRLDSASKLPVDSHNPQSVINKLDELLDNEWFVKTINHDKTDALKNQVLAILANEMLQMPGTRPESILTKLSPKRPLYELQHLLDAKIKALE